MQILRILQIFAEFDITGESRSFVKELIIEYNKQSLLYYRELMPAKQTLEELADTLTNHALLDRIGNKDFITFINEFIWIFTWKFYTKRTKWFLDKLIPFPESLVDLAVRSYQYSSEDNRLKLWMKLDKVKNRMSSYLKITTDCFLLKR